jgi:hypothetical protein
MTMKLQVASAFVFLSSLTVLLLFLVGDVSALGGEVPYAAVDSGLRIHGVRVAR